MTVATTAPSRLLVNLNLLDGPVELLVWVRTIQNDEDSWHGCDRVDWCLWMAAAMGISIPLVVVAAASCVERALDRLPAGREGSVWPKVLARASRLRDIEARLDLAHGHAELFAEETASPKKAAIPKEPSDQHVQAEQAARWLHDAVDAVRAAAASEEARRERRALHQAAVIGAAPTVMMGPPLPLILEGQLGFDEPTHDQLGFALAASAEAVRLAVASLSSGGSARDELSSHGELADLAYRILDDARSDNLNTEARS